MSAVRIMLAARNGDVWNILAPDDKTIVEYLKVFLEAKDGAVVPLPHGMTIEKMPVEVFPERQFWGEFDDRKTPADIGVDYWIDKEPK